MMDDSIVQNDIVLTQLNQQGILRVTLNNPSSRNALSQAMLTALLKVINHAVNDSLVRVILLAANGSVFCAGHDLKELTLARQDNDQGRAHFKETMLMCATLMQAIVNHPKPIIAKVSGVATAAGCQLVASCDLAYADEHALFSTPGVNIGLFCSTPMVALSRNVNAKHAMQMLLTGEMLNAQKAVEIGLINSVSTAGELNNLCMQIAQTIAAKSSKTIAVGKLAFYQQREMSLSDAYKYCSEVMVENMLAADASEGINAFIEKRQPVWSDQ